MKIQTHSLKHRAALGTLSALTLAAAGLLTTGCGIHSSDLVATPVTSQGVAFQGNIHGGQQPVAGASLQLYAASNAGYGAASYALFTIPVTSDANGNFNFTGDYTCPANAQVYLVATGGNPGAGANPNLALMSALGPCSNLTPATFITVNEITTVASAYALSPFMTGPANVGTSATNVLGLTNAFAAVNKLANITNGGSSGTLPTGATAPVTEINTLADILAACINTTGGNAGTTTTNCGKLFSYATPAGGPAPTDTITAILNIAKNPGNNVSSLLSLASPQSPFQPTMTTASDFTVSIKYKPSVSTPSAAAIDANGSVWITNGGNNTLTVLANSGTPQAGSPYTTGSLNVPSAVAIDASGNAFVTSKGSSKLSVFTPAGVGTLTPVVGLSAPSAIAIDGQGILWITNSTGNSVVAATFNGTASVSSNSYTGSGITTPVAVAINPY